MLQRKRAQTHAPECTRTRAGKKETLRTHSHKSIPPWALGKRGPQAAWRHKFKGQRPDEIISSLLIDRNNCACVDRGNVKRTHCPTTSYYILPVACYLHWVGRDGYSAATLWSQDSLGTVTLCKQVVMTFSQQDLTKATKSHTQATQQCFKYSFILLLGVLTKKPLCKP